MASSETKLIGLHSRIKGSIYGVAVTDALGGPAEFKPRGTFPYIDDFKPNTNFGLRPGTWTDDTSMTLCLAQSLVSCQGKFNICDQARRYSQWYHAGYMSATGYCFDIGNQTKRAIQIWAQWFKKHPRDVDTAPGAVQLIDETLNHESGSGNGSLMRVAPIGLLYHRSPELLATYSKQSSDVTHPYPLNGLCCTIYSHLIAGALAGKSKIDLAGLVASSDYLSQDDKLQETLASYTGIDAWQAKPEEEISSSGYVLDTLEAALWAFFTTDDFANGAIRVVNLGNDADTVGAVYGGIAGAFYGLEGIPVGWRNRLEAAQLVEDVAESLAVLATSRDYNHT